MIEIIAKVGLTLITAGISYYQAKKQEEAAENERTITDPGMGDNDVSAGEGVPIVYGRCVVAPKIVNGGQVATAETGIYNIGQSYPDALPGVYGDVEDQDEKIPVKPVELVFSANRLKSFNKVVVYFPPLVGSGEGIAPLKYAPLTYDTIEDRYKMRAWTDSILSQGILAYTRRSVSNNAFGSDDLWKLATEGRHRLYSNLPNTYHRYYLQGALYLQDTWDVNFAQNQPVDPGLLYPDPTFLEAGEIDYTENYQYFFGVITPYLRKDEEGTKDWVFPSKITAMVESYPNAGSLDQAYININGDANPVHVVHDLLTNDVYGRGESESRLDLASFDAAAKIAFDLGIGVSCVLAQDNIMTHISDMLALIDAMLLVNRETGRIKIVTAETNTLSVAAFDDSNSICEWVREHPVLSPSSVSATYMPYDDPDEPYLTHEATLDFSIATTIQDPRTISFSYPYIRSSDALRLRVTRDYMAAQRHYTSISLSVPFTKENAGLDIGDVIAWSSASAGQGAAGYRITTIDLGDSSSNEIQIQAMSNWVAADEPIVPGEPPSEREEDPPPRVMSRALDLSPQLAWKIGVPSRLPITDALNWNNWLNYVQNQERWQAIHMVEDAAGVQVVDWYLKYTDPETRLERMPQPVFRTQALKLLKPIGKSDTSVQFDGEVFDSSGAGNAIVLVNDEILLVNFDYGDFGEGSINVLSRRGIYDTVIPFYPHETGSIGWVIHVGEASIQIIDPDGPGDLNITPPFPRNQTPPSGIFRPTGYNGAMEPIDDLDEINDFVGAPRYIRPFPPSNFTGEWRTSGIQPGLRLNWTFRNRALTNPSWITDGQPDEDAVALVRLYWGEQEDEIINVAFHEEEMGDGVKNYTILTGDLTNLLPSPVRPRARWIKASVWMKSNEKTPLESRFSCDFVFKRL